MSIDKKKILMYEETFPSARDCRMKSVSPRNALPSYEYLESIRHSIPKELYAYNLRNLLQWNTEEPIPARRNRDCHGLFAKVRLIRYLLIEEEFSRLLYPKRIFLCI